jgi:ABC-2 type transport system ATP-binding protein
MRIQIRDLEKRYGQVAAVQKLSFEAEAGDIIGLLGPNGAGKSTTIKMLVGLVQPTAGEILFDGVSAKADMIRYKSCIGYVPEEPLLYPYLSGLEFLQLIGHLKGLEASVLDTRIEKLLRLFSLFPASHRPIASYSKGMKQKVLLCGALMHNPEVVVLDEPLNGLDVTAVLVLNRLIKKLASARKTVIYSSHNLDSIERLCSRVVILHQGNLVANTTVKDLQQLKEKTSLEEVFSRLAPYQSPDLIAREILGALEA